VLKAREASQLAFPSPERSVRCRCGAARRWSWGPAWRSSTTTWSGRPWPRPRPAWPPHGPRPGSPRTPSSAPSACAPRSRSPSRSSSGGGPAGPRAGPGPGLGGRSRQAQVNLEEAHAQGALRRRGDEGPGRHRHRRGRRQVIVAVEAKPTAGARHHPHPGRRRTAAGGATGRGVVAETARAPREPRSRLVLPSVDRRNRPRPVEVAVPNVDGRLLPHAFARATFPGAPSRTPGRCRWRRSSSGKARWRPGWPVPRGAPARSREAPRAVRRRGPWWTRAGRLAGGSGWWPRHRWHHRGRTRHRGRSVSIFRRRHPATGIHGDDVGGPDRPGFLASVGWVPISIPTSPFPS